MMVARMTKWRGNLLAMKGLVEQRELRNPVNNLRSNSWILGSLSIGALLGGATTARAGYLNEIGIGLDALGFEVQGQDNLLSGGVDFLVNTNFTGQPLDFGFGSLALQGPVSFQVGTGKRILPTLDIDFSTALNGDSTASPLNYLLNVDAGSQETSISGSLLVDGSFSIDGFGFYDLEMNYSSRQNVENDGRFANNTVMSDLDVGPVNVSGNIFADALAVLTDPLFEAAGTVNIFEGFSGRSQLQDAFDAAAARAQVSSLGEYESAARSIVDVGTFVVPEPPLLVLLLVGIPVIFARKSIP